MTVAALVPFRSGEDPHRDAALRYVLDRLADLHPGWQLLTNEPGDVAGEWNKGAALAALLARTSAEIIVVHDADSYVDPDNLAEIVEAVAVDRHRWGIPHGMVYRLRPEETARVLAGRRARRGHVIRTPYPAIPGGGITVVDRPALELVDGIDRRFLGWGGEDVAFGLALHTLAGAPALGGAPLIHLWHPHPAPDLRGPPASEDLVARYKAANGLPRRMAALIAGEPAGWEPDALGEPVAFRLRSPQARARIRLAGYGPITFADRRYETADPDLVDALDRHPAVTRGARR